MNWPPNPMQEAVFPIIRGNECALLLEAPTGSGKTEAVLIPALTGPMPRRLFLIYPSRSLIEDQIARLEEKILPILSNASTNKQVAIVIDHGEQSERQVWINGRKSPTQDAICTKATLNHHASKFQYRILAMAARPKAISFPSNTY
jgi:CRISPR-associated endonuclease/helicase Cas3